ncbi:hypothetical protein [Streptomyces flavofungini]|uniref:hypothetical protein n=1 Tax=Streptomyces flavofungini TaxID=68200 RepID=UPI0034DFEF03
MRFVLEVDMGETAFDGRAAEELGRILRYWGGNLGHYALEPGDAETVYDSAYRAVGGWRVTGPELPGTAGTAGTP